jgi:FdhE protein
MSSIKLTALEPSGGVEHVDPLLLPTLAQHYSRRAERLRQLADGHPMADYLRFAASVADAQQLALDQLPLPATANAQLDLVSGEAPLHYASLPRDTYWRAVLGHLIKHLQPEASAQVRGVLVELRDCTMEQLEAWADALLAGDFASVGSARALFLWSALSLYWTQLAANLALRATAELGEKRQLCPVCASTPSTSVILGNGLRYLHCGLCESRWHMVRLKCSNCEETGKLDYWSLESKDAALKAESCGDCDSYLKVMHVSRDRDLDVFADDLATLALDAEMEREGFARSGLNPFLFPG